MSHRRGVKVSELRLGQRLHNYIVDNTGIKPEGIHTYLYYMDDEEFLKVIGVDKK